MTLEDLRNRLQEKYPPVSTTEFRGELSLTYPLEKIVEVCRFCKEELDFDYLVDISSVDHFGDDPRFEMVYELYSYETALHLRLKAAVAEDVEVPSVTSLWPTADWHEREVYDMMGIIFSGHPDLRRILMWEGYPYYPLRKDFPLQGKPSQMPDVAFTQTAPLEGGPFVTSPGEGPVHEREPRAKS